MACKCDGDARDGSYNLTKRARFQVHTRRINDPLSLYTVAHSIPRPLLNNFIGEKCEPLMQKNVNKLVDVCLAMPSALHWTWLPCHATWRTSFRRRIPLLSDSIILRFKVSGPRFKQSWFNVLCLLSIQSIICICYGLVLLCATFL